MSQHEVSREQRVIAELAAQRNSALDALAQVAAELAATREEVERLRKQLQENSWRPAAEASEARRRETGEARQAAPVHTLQAGLRERIASAEALDDAYALGGTEVA